MSVMKFLADSTDDEEATAVTMCTMSVVPRVLGSIRRSLVNVRAMPPVAVKRKLVLMGLYICCE